MQEIEFNLLTEPWVRVRLPDNTINMNKISVGYRRKALLAGGREMEICRGGLSGREA